MCKCYNKSDPEETVKSTSNNSSTTISFNSSETVSTDTHRKLLRKYYSIKDQRDLLIAVFIVGIILFITKMCLEIFI